MKAIQSISILLLLAILSSGSAFAEGLAKRIGKPLPQATSATLHAQQKGDGILLRWTVVPNCDGYRLYHQDGDQVHSGSNWIPVDGATVSIHQYDNVVPGGHYSFMVSPRYGSESGPTSPAVTVIMKDKQPSVRSDAGK